MLPACPQDPDPVDPDDCLSANPGNTTNQQANTWKAVIAEPDDPGRVERHSLSRRVYHFSLFGLGGADRRHHLLVFCSAVARAARRRRS